MCGFVHCILHHFTKGRAEEITGKLKQRKIEYSCIEPPWLLTGAVLFSKQIKYQLSEKNLFFENLSKKGEKASNCKGSGPETQGYLKI